MLGSLDHRSAFAELDRLTERARAGDLDAEAHAVVRRYELGRDLLGAPTRPDPAATRYQLPEDPFPEVWDRPPEIDHGQLDAELFRAALVHHGCLLVHDFFPPETIERLRADIDEVADGFEAWMDSGQRTVTAPWFRPLDAPGAERPLEIRAPSRLHGTFYAPDSPRGLRDLVDAFDAAGMRELVHRYMGEPSLLSLEKTALRRVPPGLPTVWHQDGMKFGVDVGLVNLWVALCDCGVDAPTLGVIPRRIDEILPLRTGGDVAWEIEPAALEAAAGDAPLLRLELRPGDAILFDELLVHSTIAPDDMDTMRYCADAWFFPLSAFPSDYVPLAYSDPDEGRDL